MNRINLYWIMIGSANKNIGIIYEFEQMQLDQNMTSSAILIYSFTSYLATLV